MKTRSWIFPFCTRITWQANLKKTKVSLEILTDIDMILKVESGIRGKICHDIHRYVKANKKYMQIYGKNKKLYLKYLDANNLYRWAMSQTLPADGFKWVKNTSQFNKDL